MLSSLGFVFGALIEFAIIIVLKRSARNTKISPNEEKNNQVYAMKDQNNKAVKFNALRGKLKQLKIEKQDQLEKLRRRVVA